MFPAYGLLDAGEAGFWLADPVSVNQFASFVLPQSATEILRGGIGDVSPFLATELPLDSAIGGINPLLATEIVIDEISDIDPLRATALQ